MMSILIILLVFCGVPCGVWCTVRFVRFHYRRLQHHLPALEMIERWSMGVIGWWSSESDYKLYLQYGRPKPLGRIPVQHSTGTAWSDHPMEFIVKDNQKKGKYIFFADTLNADAGRKVTTAWCDA